MTRAALLLLRLYKRHLSARLNRTCRYEPTCSEYARLAILKLGVARGIVAAGQRLASCGAWSRRPFIDYP